MLSFLNQKFRFLLILVLALIAVSFVFFSDSPFGQGSPGNNRSIAKINGANIKVRDFEEARRETMIIYTLQTGRLPQNSEDMQRILRNQTWNRLVVLAAARNAGMQVSQEDLKNYYTSHPLFTNEQGAFEYARVKMFIANVCNPQGIDETRLESIISNQLLFEQMIQSISDTVVIQPYEIDEAYRNLYGEVALRYVEVSEAAVRASIKPSEEDLKAFYKANEEEWRTPEKRKVEYVLIQLDPKEENLPSEQKHAAMNELAKAAYSFTEPFFTALDAGSPIPDFKAEAEKAGLKVLTSDYLGATTPGAPASLDRTLESLARTLTQSKPVSDYHQTTNGFLVAHLIDIMPSEIPAYEQVKDLVKKAYVDRETLLGLRDQGKALGEKLKEDIASGKTWDEAVKEAGLKSESLPPFTPAKSQDMEGTDANTIRYWGQRMQKGAVSDFTRSDKGGRIFYVAERKEPADDGSADNIKARIKEELLQQRRYQILDDWITAQMRTDKNNVPLDLLRGDAGQTL